jgi:hypothetical protein
MMAEMGLGLKQYHRSQKYVGPIMGQSQLWDEMKDTNLRWFGSMHTSTHENLIGYILLLLND